MWEEEICGVIRVAREALKGVVECERMDLVCECNGSAVWVRV